MVHFSFLFWIVDYYLFKYALNTHTFTTGRCAMKYYYKSKPKTQWLLQMTNEYANIYLKLDKLVFKQGWCL